MKAGSARKLDIVLRSASGLKKVTTSRMAAYAVAWLDPSVRVPSPMDKRHGRNPVWDTTISITLDEHTLGRAGKNLHIELLAHGLVSTAKPIGFIRIDLTELLLKGSQGAAVNMKYHDYPVLLPLNDLFQFFPQFSCLKWFSNQTDLRIYPSVLCISGDKALGKTTRNYQLRALLTSFGVTVATEEYFGARQ